MLVDLGLGRADPGAAIADFDRAERFAAAVDQPASRAYALMSIAIGVAAVDPDRAERVAAAITTERLRDVTLGRIAGALVAVDPDRAERVATEITDGFEQVMAVVLISEEWLQLASCNPSPTA